MPDSLSMAARLAHLKQAVAEACARVERAPDDVSILPVSKTFPIEQIRLAQGLGFARFGENRLQEVRQKAEAMTEDPPAWVVIGPVQTNKAKDVVRWAAELQTLDRMELAEALDRRLQSEGRALDVLVQVKTAAEAGKHGLAPGGLNDFVHTITTRFDTLRIRGLMTVATQTENRAVVQACFAQLRTLREAALQACHGDATLDRLSMGMSGDFDLAIAEGATEIRIGSALFGQR